MSIKEIRSLSSEATRSGYVKTSDKAFICIFNNRYRNILIFKVYYYIIDTCITIN